MIYSSLARKLLDYVHEGSEAELEYWESKGKEFRDAFEHGLYLGVFLTLSYLSWRLEEVKESFSELEDYVRDVIEDIKRDLP